MNDKLMTDIRYLKGIGEAKAKLFCKLGVFSVGDLLSHYPKTYQDRSVVKNIIDLQEGDEVCVMGVVLGNVAQMRKGRNFTIQSLGIGDKTGSIRVVWFNSPFLKDAFKAGEQYIFFGKVSVVGGRKQLNTPIFENALKAQELTGRIVPIYPLTAMLTQKNIQNAMRLALGAFEEEIDEFLPLWIRKEYELAEARYSIENIHFPNDLEHYLIARRRLVFEEFFLLQLGLFAIKGERKQELGRAFGDISAKDEFIKKLPFRLTAAQQRVIGEMVSDMTKDVPMNRLIQGDVGSGKTVVAAVGICVACKNGYQSVMMVPTEILAKQHYESLKEILGALGITVAILTGSMKPKEKKEVLEKLKSGEIDALIGTHALIQENVVYKNLGFVVTDEQHRFGVLQRAAIAGKGNNPHTLVMSATPIPRTLALILYGDLDISVIDELPPGRKKVDTYAVGEDMRERIYKFIDKELEAKRQAYIVCPMVNESEVLDLKAVTNYTETLQTEVFPDRRVALIHGKMKPKDKEDIMNRFSAREIDILVSTTVIEVGINVPNASVMVIENAERFGLSQLHQLRGRVGRGSDKAYCIMFNGGEGAVAKARMEIMAKTNDGFLISERDLEIRGPGEFFGTRQHGIPELKIANLFSDRDLLKLAQTAALAINKKDPRLKQEEHLALKEKVEDMFSGDIMFN